MDSSTKIERTAAGWLARRDANTWSDEDQAELNVWLETAIAHRVAYIRLQSAWQQAGRLKALGAGVPRGQIPSKGQWTLSPFFSHGEAVEESSPPTVSGQAESLSNGVVSGWHRHGAKQLRRPRSKRRGWLKMGLLAVCLLLAVPLGLGLRRYTAVQSTAYSTPMGGTQTVSLDDGSQAVLSSDSSVAAAMSRSERHIDLQQGEAFFEVAKDAQRPFVVAVGDRRVIAVGTRFSVRRNADGLRVVVTEGIVRLETGADMPAQQRVMRLPAGSVALVGKNGVSIQSVPVDKAEEYLSWRSGFVVFRDTSLADAVAEFNRYSAQKLVVNDAQTAAIRVGGHFRLSNTEAFVRLLEQGFSIRPERLGDRIVLHSE
ncbi:FecR family protein [Rudaea cellulosilytica]|uniref:FecR family protein n=1 Tax=Rudaea cellulosilytica TaxID=540746 RepID=UPI0003A6013B|nr:FecR domain-containing protein [Rudaea cellulosilytica]